MTSAVQTAFRSYLFSAAFVILVAALAVIPRAFLADVPFDRDEGAYAYVSDTVDLGGLPYRDAFDHKPPVVYYLYNISFRLFGNGISSPRFMGMIFVFFGCLCVHYIIRKITKSYVAGILAMPLLGLVTLAPVYSGYAANTETFLFPCLLGGCCFLLDPDGSRLRPFAAGSFFGVAFAIKPVAIPFILAGGIALLLRDNGKIRRNLSALAAYSMACALPIGLFCVYFYAKGAFRSFWEGVFLYNAGYATRVTLGQSWGYFIDTMRTNLAAEPVSWVAGAAGAAIYFTAREAREKYVVAAFLSAALLSVAMPRYFYGHYFLIIVPFLVICAGLGAGVLMKRAPVPVVSVFLLLIAGTTATQAGAFRISHQELLKRTYGHNPFYQSVAVAEYLKARALAGDRVYIVGSEPQILNYSGLRSPGRFFYFYPLTGSARLKEAFRKENFSDLKKFPPAYLVFANALTSHFLNIYKDRDFMVELFGFFGDYELVAASPFMPGGVVIEPARLLDEKMLGSMDSVLIFRRPGAGAPATGVRFSQIYQL